MANILSATKKIAKKCNTNEKCMYVFALSKIYFFKWNSFYISYSMEKELNYMNKCKNCKNKNDL